MNTCRIQEKETVAAPARRSRCQNPTRQPPGAFACSEAFMASSGPVLQDEKPELLPELLDQWPSKVSVIMFSVHVVNLTASTCQVTDQMRTLL